MPRRGAGRRPAPGGAPRARRHGGLSATEERLRLALAGSRHGVWDWDVEHDQLTCDARCRELLGITDEVPSYRAFLAAVHPDDRERVEHAVARVAREHAGLDEEFRVGPRDAPRWLQARGQGVCTTAGSVRRMSGTLLDVTARRAPAEALRESEARFRSVLDNSYDCVYRRDLRRQTLDYMSPSIERITGYTAAEVTAMRVEDFLDHIHPEDRAHRAAELREAERTGHRIIEYRFRHRDGDYRWLADHATVTRDEHGEPRFRGGTLRDVTARKLADQALRQSEERYRRLFEAMTDALLLLQAVTEADGTPVDYVCLEVNPAYEALFGVPRSARVGRRATEFLGHVEYLEVFDQVLDSDRSVAFEAYFAPIDRHLRIAAFAPEAGRVAVTFEDVSERKRAEAALREADQRKDEFIALLSHELRNPLAPIRNSLTVLARAVPGSEPATRAREVIERQVAQLTRLVDDLLDLNRVSRGKVQLERQQCDLADLVARTLEDHHAAVMQKGVALQLEQSPEPLWLDADPTRIAQVVGNLLDNAVKFTPGGGRVDLALAADGDAALLIIRDSGEGIAPEMLEHIFEPFTQGDRTLDRSRSGLGLGLALVKGMVELHGGTVTASSAGSGHGAEFRVRLPRRPAAANAPRPRAPAPAPAPPTNALTILVIEDNVDAADSLRDVLMLLGHQVTVAYSGPAGLAAARAAPPDAILCDIGLPDVDGYAVARELRAQPQLADCYLVALTGYAQPDDIRRAADAGFAFHLAKPPTLERLEELLARIAQARPAAASGDGAHPGG